MPADPYHLLGVPPNASEAEVRAAYRRRAAQVHPDRYPPEQKDWAAEQMRQLNAARDALLASPRPAPAPANDWEAFMARQQYRAAARQARQRRRWLIGLIGLGASGVFLLGAGWLLLLTAPGVVGWLVQLALGVGMVFLYTVVPLVIAGLLAYLLIVGRQ